MLHGPRFQLCWIQRLKRLFFAAADQFSMSSLIETVANLNKLKELITRMRKMKITAEEYAYLKALALFSVGKRLDILKSVCDIVSTALKFNFGKKTIIFQF